MWWDNPVSSNPLRSYRPGTWFGIVGARALVALPPTEKSRVAALWELVDEGAGFDITLDALISSGLRALPGFVLVSTDEGQTDVVIRGAAVATFTVDGEDVVVEGSSATTWVERSIQGVSRMRIELEPSAEDGSDEASFVVDGGMFRVSLLEETRDVGDLARPVRALHVVETPETDGFVAVAALTAVPVAPELAPDLGEPQTEDQTEPQTEDQAEDQTEDQAEEPEDELEAPIWAAQEDLVEEVDPETEVDLLPVRSPDPPSWTPPPPPVDLDGPTLTGAPLPAPPLPGIPGQEPALDLTRVVARLAISSGQTVDVDRVTIIGRAPTAPDGLDAEPLLVTVPSAHYEISSTHIEIRPGSGADQGAAVVTDLGSTNGTVVVLPGLGPQDLAPGEAVQLVPGALIDIGDGITIQVTRP